MKKLIFFNSFHNGDVHLGRSFVRHISEIYNYEHMEYQHPNSLKLVKDIKNIKSTQLINFQRETIINDTIIETNKELFINTWIGQQSAKFVVDYGGCTFTAYYEMFKDIYKKLNIHKHFLEKEKYLPKINFYDYENIEFIKNFMLNKNKNIFISNQEVKSGQIQNFNFDKIIIFLANTFKENNFFVSGKTPYLEQFRTQNIYFTRDLTSTTENDLNENGFISTFCDIIVGRSSGAYCFTQISENYLDSSKTFICFDNYIANGFWISSDDSFVKAKIYAYNFSEEQRVLDILYKHIKEKYNL